MATSGLSCGEAFVGICWAISLLLCMTGLRKQTSGLVESPFLSMKLYSQSAQVVIG